MKKKVFRKWVEVVLYIILFISILIIVSECENTILFITSHLVAILTFVISAILIYTFGRGIK